MQLNSKSRSAELSPSQEENLGIKKSDSKTWNIKFLFKDLESES